MIWYRPTTASIKLIVASRVLLTRTHSEHVAMHNYILTTGTHIHNVSGPQKQQQQQQNPTKQQQQQQLVFKVRRAVVR